MDGEIFDVLDERGFVIGQEERLAVHLTGLLHASVHVVVLVGDQVVIQKRAQGKRIAPGSWDLSAAEHLQPGESYLQAAVRGLMEELHITASSQELLLLREKSLCKREYTFVDHQGQSQLYKDYEFTCLYVLERESKQDLIGELQSSEVSQVLWVTKQELTERLENEKDTLTAWFIDDMPYILKHINGSTE